MVMPTDLSSPECAVDGAVVDDRYIVPGLVRGLALLECFGAERQELSIAEMVRMTGLSRATAFRLTYTLDMLGYLERVGSGRTYRLGTKVLSLGYSLLAGRDLVDIATPFLERLRDETRCSTHLVVREGKDIVYLARCAGNTRLISGITVGTRFPAYATVTGRAILAHLPMAEVVMEYEKHAFHHYTPSTVGTLGELVSQLELDRNRPSLVSWGYFEPDVATIAVPIRNRAGKVEAAINATCPLDTYSREEFETRICTAVERTVRDISRAMGYLS